MLRETASLFAEEKHRGQFRIDGLPYFSHCEAVARIISEEWGINDNDLIIAAYLHDVVEDTSVTSDEIRELFGSSVAALVEGVSKFKSDSARETLRKVLDLNLIDPRAAILKLGDRLHNMRTLDVMPPEKQVAKAQETLEVYSKLAESLGIWVVMKELEDLSLKYVDPEGFVNLSDQFQNDARTGDLFMTHMVSSLESQVRESGIKANVVVRKNSLWRLRHKSERVPRYRDVNDVISLRVIVDGNSTTETARNDCYKFFGILREQHSDIENTEKFNDYFSNPQDNGYSAIQMTINTPQGAVEIAITTLSREEFNNWGVVSLIKKGERELSQYARKLVFTPSGQVKFFAKEATGVDFAYSISRGLGAQAVGLVVDGNKQPLSFVIPNGSTVEIITGEQKIAPDGILMNYCSPYTRKIIEEQLGDLVREQRIKEGKDSIEKVIIEKCGLIDLIDLFSFDEYRLKLTNILYQLGCKGSLTSLYYLVGSNLMSVEKLVDQLTLNGLTKDELKLSTILLEGGDRPGMLENVGSIVNRVGGNVGALDLKRQKNEGEYLFSLRLVVENLSEDAKEKIKEDFEKNNGVRRILVV